MMGAASRGAIWSSCSPDFGERGILDRFGQIAPKVLIASDGYYYNGKEIDIADKLVQVAAELPSVEKVVIIPYLGRAEEVAARIDGAVTLDALIAGHEPCEIPFTQVPFDHPLYILFSSGTTGVPKCIVHAGGAGPDKALERDRFSLRCQTRRPAVFTSPPAAG